MAIYSRAREAKLGCRRGDPANALARLSDQGEARERDEGGADERQRCIGQEGPSAQRGRGHGAINAWSAIVRPWARGDER